MIQARSVRLAAVIVLGGAVALATSACGGPMQAGAAAVVQGQRTTDATIQAQVASLVSLVQKNNPQQADITDAQRAGFSQAQVALLVQEAIWQKAADDQGLSVTAAADAQVRTIVVEQDRAGLGGKQFTGSDNEAVALADLHSQQPSYLAPNDVPGFIHMQAAINAVVNDLGAKMHLDPSDQNAVPTLRAALQPILGKAADEIKVKISPRYGSYDPAQRQLVAAQTAWIRPTAAQIAAAAAAQQQQSP
jgi:hypothetical protein